MNSRRRERPGDFRHAFAQTRQSRRRFLGRTGRDAGGAAFGRGFRRDHLYPLGCVPRRPRRIGRHPWRDGFGLGGAGPGRHQPAHKCPLRAGGRGVVGVYPGVLERRRRLGAGAASAVDAGAVGRSVADCVRSGAFGTLDRIHALSGGERLFVRGGPLHHRRPGTQVSRRAERHAFLAGARHAGGLAVAGHGRGRRHYRRDARRAAPDQARSGRHFRAAGGGDHVFRLAQADPALLSLAGNAWWWGL